MRRRCNSCRAWAPSHAEKLGSTGIPPLTVPLAGSQWNYLVTKGAMRDATVSDRSSGCHNNDSVSFRSIAACLEVPHH